MLRVDGVTKAYGEHPVLRGVDLDVAAGQILGLVGANGAGKTTLISIITGLRRCDGGSVAVGGVDALAHPKRAAGSLGLAPQELGIYPTLTARENLYDFARLAGMSSRAARTRTAEVAELLGLTEQLGLRGDQLSGGQKRRLHTAMAILHRPRLLLLDEPTVGADVTSRAGILEIVRATAAAGTAVLYTTHYLTELSSSTPRSPSSMAGWSPCAAPAARSSCAGGRHRSRSVSPGRHRSWWGGRRTGPVSHPASRSPIPGRPRRLPWSPSARR